MKRKNNTTVALLFLSIAYMVFCESVHKFV